MNQEEVLEQEPIAIDIQATTATTPTGPTAHGPMPVTQEEPEPNSDEPEDLGPFPDDDSVHSADGDLDNHHVSPESVDVHLHNLAGDMDHEDLFDSIIGHRVNKATGNLEFEVRWKTEDTEFYPWTMCREDFPYETAVYIRDNKIGAKKGKYSTGPHQRWPRTFLKKTRRVLRRFLRHAGYHKPMAESTVFRYPEEKPVYNLKYTVVHPRSAPRKSCRRTKPGRIRRPLEMKFGVKIPRTVRQALELDQETGTDHWKQAMEKEIASLVAMNCFTFHPPDYKPGPNSQHAPLRMIFEVKQDGRRKGRLVCGGHLIDPRGSQLL